MRMSSSDIQTIAKWLDKFQTLSFLELGTWRGGWEETLRARFGDNFIYTGVDNGIEAESSPTTIFSDTLDAVDKVPSILDAVLIDACHCEKHVCLDFWLYGPKVRPGGGVIFHDTAESRQNLPMGYGCAWSDKVGVRAAIARLFPREGWAKVTSHDGIYGVEIYEKL